MTMIYPGLYPFSGAYQKAFTTNPVQSFAAERNEELGMVEQQRQPNVKLIIAFVPDKQRSSLQLFFNPT